MKYEDLTLNQRIGLKNEFIQNPKCAPYRLIWIIWNFKYAVEYFLNDDITALPIEYPEFGTKG